MRTKMIDNQKLGTVADELRQLLDNDSRLSVISAYFTIYAYQELSKELSKIDSIRLLFTEPSFLKAREKEAREYYIDTRRESRISGNEFELKLRNELTQSQVAKECAAWLAQKAEIRSYKTPNPAQQRLIHIKNEIEDAIITGSVDFTSDGLGLAPSNRIDINTCIYGNDATKSYLAMFDQIWNNTQLVEDVKERVLEFMQVIYKENPPQYVYMLTLFYIFHDFLDELDEEAIIKSKTGFKETRIWNMLYRFQRDGVIGAIDKIEKYNGCIIADSVGLGKTFTALAVIKYYELRNDRVLVLVPKKLRENWTIYTQNDKRNILVQDRYNFDVLNHTDLSRYDGYSGEINLATINWENYDLIVIDESHNFRNNEPAKDRVTRYSRLMNQVIKKGVKTKVLLLSATPVNNRMTDIKNQIAFITEGRDTALEKHGIPSIDTTLRKAQKVFNIWSELPEQLRTVDGFVEMMHLDYFRLLDTLTIARSRKHIEKYYDLEEVGKFPERLKPVNIHAPIDLGSGFPELSEFNRLILGLTLGSYTPLKYVLPQKRKQYDEKYDMQLSGQSVFKQTDRELSLINLMRINLLKRMESSIHSFKITVGRLISQIELLLGKIDSHDNSYTPDYDITNIDLDDAVLEDMMIGRKVKVLLQDMDLVRWKFDLQEDLKGLKELHDFASMVTPERDAKLLNLRERIQEKIANPLNPGNKKVLVFTAFADTATYLYEQLAEWCVQTLGVNAAMVSGSDQNQSTMQSLKRKEYNNILTSFSPRSKERAKLYPELKEEIDILIATDCISEGQNLQDCDYLINYDIHWNPVRIIQRFGRIDRLGSINQCVQLVNYWPNMELDEYIRLESRVTGRMVMLDVSATGEENVIQPDDKKAMNDLEYRRRQLEQLQEEVISLEEVAGGISITDVAMNDFRMDLMAFMKDGRRTLEKSPLGIYAVTSLSGTTLGEDLKPGVIFTLRQINSAVKPEKHNPLYPYYMVYVAEDGEIIANYLHVKKILDYYRKLCGARESVDKELLAAFNQQTNDGRDMSYFSGMLQEVINSIIGQGEMNAVDTLFHKGGTALKESTARGREDFELVSFLVIRE